MTKATPAVTAAVSLLALACSSGGGPAMGTPGPTGGAAGDATPAAAGPASAAVTSIWEGAFSDAQAERGAVLYRAQCASCHGRELLSDSGAPNLTEPGFRFGWHGATMAERLDLIRSSMPPGFAESLTDQEYLDIITFILRFNDYPTGTQELAADQREVLEQIVIEPPQ